MSGRAGLCVLCVTVCQVVPAAEKRTELRCEPAKPPDPLVLAATVRAAPRTRPLLVLLSLLLILSRFLLFSLLLLLSVLLLLLPFLVLLLLTALTALTYHCSYLSLLLLITALTALTALRRREVAGSLTKCCLLIPMTGTYSSSLLTSHFSSLLIILPIDMSGVRHGCC